MTRALIWLLLMTLLPISCAVPVPPTGGPEDEEPPRIVSIEPDSGATSVGVTEPLTIGFSEQMNRSKIERLVTTYPPFEIGEIKWNKNSISIQPATPFVSDTTYLLIIKPGFRDGHNVADTQGYSSVFATASRIDSGSISGSVIFRRKPTDRAVVRCFVIRSDTLVEPQTARPDREVKTRDQGSFSFSFLPTDDARFIVWAFQDQNGNDYFERGQEFGQVFPDTIILSAQSPRRSEAAISIIDPTEPGDIEGVVVNESGIDTFFVAVALYVRSDSLEKVAHYGICDKTGSFRFKKVDPGSYWLRSFVDLQPDSLCGTYRCLDDTTSHCEEPCVEYPDSVMLTPGGTVTLDSLILREAGETVRDH